MGFNFHFLPAALYVGSREAGCLPSVYGFGVVTSSGAAASSTHGGGRDVTGDASVPARPIKQQVSAAPSECSHALFLLRGESEARDPEASSLSSARCPSPPGPASTAAHSDLALPCLPPPPPPAAAPAELPQRPRRRRAEGPMRAPPLPLAPVVLSLLIIGSGENIPSLSCGALLPPRAKAVTS